MTADPQDPVALFDRKALTDGIVFRLSVIVTCLKWHSKRGENDNCKTVEFVVARFLGALCGWDLKRLEEIRKNYPAADLGDFERKLCIQVTVNEATQKIIDTHEKATTHKLAEDFDRLILLFLLPAAPKMPGKKSGFTACSKPEIEIWAQPRLDAEIDGATVGRLREALRVLRDEMTAIDRLIARVRISNLPFDSLRNLFIGRAAFMDDLAAALRSGGGTVIKSVQAIHGMGGVGKTRAAIEYAWRHAADFHALLFVTADGPDSMRRNLAALCAPDILNLPEHTAPETETQIAAALHWLRENRDWLLILDNVDSPETQAALLRMTTPLTHGKILITSRLFAWPTGFSALDLDVLSPEDSLQLLLDHTAGQRRVEPDETTAAAEIARLVDGLALALEQAAAFIRKNRCSFSTYLARWHEADARLRDYQPRGVGDYHATIPGQQPQEELPRSLWVTFDTSFRLLEPPARHLLQVLSWLAPASMPVEHLDALAAIPTATDHLADLDDLHLIRRTPENDAFSVHRLIQEILRREQSEAQPPALRTALEWVNGLYPLDSDDIRFWPVAAPLTPHTITLAHSAADRDIPEPSTRLLHQAAVFLNARADHRSAEPLMRRALAIDEASYGPDHPKVAIRRNNLASLLKATNRLAEAEPLMRRHLEIFLQFTAATGHPHPHLQAAAGSYAGLLSDMGRSEEEIRATLAEMGQRHGLSLAGPDDPNESLPPAAPLPVLQKIMQDQEKLPEILARLEQEDPALLQQLIAFIQNQQA